MVKLLIVEDNLEINKNIQEYFKDDFEIKACYNAEDALYELESLSYDIAVLDLMLPDESGMTILKFIREKQLNTGVIILTAKEELGEKLKAFNLGADDYLTKPFFMEELKARINVILKSMGKLSSSNLLEFKELKIDLKAKKAFIGSDDLKLNEKLYKLLEYLTINKGVLLFKEQIFDNVCGYGSDAATEIVEVYISRLRKKLNEYGYGKYLITKRGMGYMFDEKCGE